MIGDADAAVPLKQEATAFASLKAGRAEYHPFQVVYTKSTGRRVTYNVGSWVSCQDWGIIIALFVSLWATYLLMYALLMKAALDTDETSTALWIFFAVGLLLVASMGLVLWMDDVERALDAKHNPSKKAATAD